MSEQRGLKNLETWAKRVTSGYSGVEVRNMTSSFRDGLAFCAIIHHYHPEHIDFDSLSKENILYNNSLAFSTAEKKLGVPALLDAEDMVKYPVPDLLSIATYLSQLRNCFENQNRVNKVKPAVKRVLKEGQSGPPAKYLGDSKNSVPRSHETCQECKHRVFLLERLMVSGKLYHRTCFKCSKCGTLLKPGAYVESDATGKYECAICPRDEKKNLERKSSSKDNAVTEMSNGFSKETPPAVSPLAAPKLPVLSAKFNDARSNFLQENIKEKHQEPVHDLSSSSKSSSSSESLSGASDHAAFGDSPQNLDSGFKDESASDDLSCELPKLNMEVEKTEVRKSFPSLPIWPSGVKTDSESNGSNKPYQSIFTRELLHATSLKSISSRSGEAVSPTGLEPLSNKQLSTNIPFIRPTANRTATSLSHQSYIGVGHRSSTSVNSLQEDDRRSSENGKETVNHKWRDQLRRSSLGTNGQPITDATELGKDGLQHVSHPNVSKFCSTTTSLVSNVSPEFRKNDSDIEKDSLDYPKEEFVSGTSVRQLIRLREASIRESKLPATAFTPSPKIAEIAKHKVPESSYHSPFITEAENSSNDFPKNSEAAEHNQNYAIEKDTSEISTETPSEVKVESQSKSRAVSKSDDISEPDSVAEIVQHVEQKLLETEKLALDDKTSATKYPGELNPFGDEDEDIDTSKPVHSDMYPDSLNPFGDDEADEQVKEVKVSVQVISSSYDESKNPFASDDEDDYNVQPPPLPITRTPVKSPVPTSVSTKSISSTQMYPQMNNTESPTGSVKGTLKKRQAPKPPHVKELFLNTSLGSQTSLSTLDSSSPSKMSPSPKLRKNKRAPLPPSPSVGSNELSHKDAKDMNSPSVKDVTPPPSPAPSGRKSPTISETSSGSNWKKKKRPAPPVPIPQRREIKKIPLHQIQEEMSEIEEKQVDLENQGRELEVLIRDRDKDVEPTIEEEEHIMQLFELVNQKNALFRRQAELMYIKRSQRLEEEQVELEFQIRCLMNKPQSQKTEEDKKHEEKLVQQLLDVVDQRNEIIDSIELDRRREAEEDVSVQEQMEIKTGDLPITAEIKMKSKKKEKKHKKEKKKKKGKKEEKITEKEEETSNKKGTIRKKWF